VNDDCELSDLIEFVTNNVVTSILLLPNGDLVLKAQGNNSGSNETTPDNILSHVHVVAYFILKLYRDTVELPVIKRLLEEIAVFLYGDDDIMSLPFIPNDPEGILSPEQYCEKILRGVFAEFGWEIDPFKISQNLEDHEFLGFNFTRYGDYWIPRYKEPRLLAAFCYDYEKNFPREHALTKAYSLTVMAAGGDREVFEIMRSCVETYLRNWPVEQITPIVRSFMELGPPTFEDCMHFYCGFESSQFGRFLEGGGWYKEEFDTYSTDAW
jgi:hypothetical protein